MKTTRAFFALILSVQFLSHSVFAAESKSLSPAAQQSEKSIFAKARQLYSAKNYSAAIAEYSKIPTGSPRWPLAKEELGWSYFRAKDHSQALAQVRSLTNDYLNTQIDLEPFLLQSIILLYNCDYKSVYKTLADVKSKMATFVSAMDTLSKDRWNEVQTSAMTQLLTEKTHTGLKPEQFHQLPRRFFQDKYILNAFKIGNATNLKKRFEQLARIEDRKNTKLLQNLHLVEIESIQRAFVPNDFKGKQRMAVPQDDNIMIFNNDNELWADEVDKVQADVNLCASKTGKTL